MPGEYHPPFEDELLGIYISLDRLNKGEEYEGFPATMVQVVKLMGHGYDLVEFRSVDHPKDKVLAVRCYLYDENRNKQYFGSFFPVNKLLGVNVRNWSYWSPPNSTSL